MLDRHPVRGISRHVHTHVASREGFRVMNSDRTLNFGTDEEQQIRMPHVAHSFAQFVKMARDLKLDGAAALA
jgi:hypothetical protein